MKVKIDTKEKFYAITLMEPILSANIAADLSQLVTKFLQQKIKNVVLKLSALETIEDKGAEELAQLQQLFYENNASFVVCELSRTLEDRLEEMELMEVMNITPTESEAWDIVQMEEIERELLDEETGEES
ncbi:STAS domain-containing protein [Segetibacter koreensis]|uniref:STAS domain-containing protein n=1 Tax=Segetibacter koreensis TaxID=398037 RepID=UPI0003667690|nr:STAS domain-containing protein [Segetibacter koreensis]